MGHLRANHVKETFRNLDLLIVNVREQLAQFANVWWAAGQRYRIIKRSLPAAISHCATTG
jgi:hypothetical protein